MLYIRFWIPVLFLLFTSSTRSLAQEFNFEFSIPDEWTGGITASRIVVDNRGNIYVADNNATVITKYDSTGMKILDFTNDAARFSSIGDMAIDSKNRIYIIDPLNSYNIVIYNEKGEWLNTLKAYPYDITHLFRTPAAIATDKANALYIADNYTPPTYLSKIRHVYKVDATGKSLQTWVIHNATALGSITVDKDGSLFIVDTGSNRIYKYSAAGDSITTFGAGLIDSTTYTYFDGESSPPGYGSISTDAQGNVWVTDENNSNIKLFSKDGIYLKSLSINQSYYYPINELTINKEKFYMGDGMSGSRLLVYQLLPDTSTITTTIAGKESIPLNVPQTYHVYPKNESLRYVCSFKNTDDSHMQVISANSSSMKLTALKTDPSAIKVIAFEGATADTLVCDIYTSDYTSLYDTVSLYISPVTSPNGYALPEVTCENNVLSDCSGDYIKTFSLNTIMNTNNTCNLSGYSDYSAVSSTILKQGTAYTGEITLKTTSNVPAFAALWIDFNNDGDFEDADEFMGTAIAAEGKVKFVNINIPDNATNTGSVRLRVRTRAINAFEPSEACIQYGDSGETEDYALKIERNTPLSVPEVITPNNDGLNDRLLIRGITSDVPNTLIITDALGNKVFEKTDYRNNWPNASTASALQKGTYYYFFKNGSSTIKGFFLLNY